ncbi:MAG: ABC transporter permease, partial [Deltaproteobacteria bacterium]|nr:ABC transporter permease [Deltaproteobacteria bacterium]
MNRLVFNRHGVWAIYRFEMARAGRTFFQSVVAPVITTSLYFVVFGAAIGSRMAQVDGVAYGAFIVPGLIMLSLFTQSISNASFGIYFPKFTGTIYELLSAPVSSLEIVIAYVGAAATKSIILGLIILATAAMFVPLRIVHPVWMIAFLVLTAATF